MNYHFRVFKDVVDATKQKMSFNDIVGIFRRVDIKEMSDADSWFLVFCHNFDNKNGNGCCAGNLNRGTFFR